MLYRQLFSEFAQRDLWLLLTLLFWYSVLTVLPGMTGGMLAQRYARGNYEFSPSQSHRRCFYASLVTFLVMVVIGLAVNWWETKPFYSRIAWCAFTLLAGFVVPFAWEIYRVRVPATLPDPASKVGSRWRVSLRSIVLLQLIGLVAGGFWIGGLRQEVAAKIDGRRQWLLRQEFRTSFRYLGWESTLEFEGPKCQLKLTGDGRANPAEVLLEIRPDDQITSLDINGTNLTDADLQAINKLTTLERLTIRNSPLGAGLADLSDLRRLKYLRLKAPAINSAALMEVARLPMLEELQIECDLLSDSDLAELCRSSLVPNLSIESKAVTDQALPAIEANASLKRLDIRGSKISRRAAVELQTKRPELEGWFNQTDDSFE